MPKATKSARKRVSVKNLPAKVKDVSKKDARRVKGATGTLPRTLTINGLTVKN